MTPQRERRPLVRAPPTANRSRRSGPVYPGGAGSARYRYEYRISWRRKDWTEATKSKSRTFSRRSDAEALHDKLTGDQRRAGAANCPASRRWPRRRRPVGEGDTVSGGRRIKRGSASQHGPAFQPRRPGTELSAECRSRGSPLCSGPTTVTTIHTRRLRTAHHRLCKVAGGPSRRLNGSRRAPGSAKSRRRGITGSSTLVTPSAGSLAAAPRTGRIGDDRDGGHHP